MENTSLIPTPLSRIPAGTVSLVHGVATTTSLDVARVFEKQHKDVLETIRAIEIPEEFSGRNFPPAESAGQTDPFVAEAYTDQQGKWRPMYRMTRDGFTFLVMGFTGEKAARFKWLYIAEFNRMEAALAKETAPPADCQLVPTAEYIGLLKEKIAWLEGRGQETVKRPPRLPLSQDEVAEIRRLKGLGHSLREVAGLTGRSRATVSLVCRDLRQEVAR